MTKADLRSGMKVTCRNGKTYLVLTNSTERDGKLIGIGKNSGSWIDLWNWKDDLTYRESEWDIMEVAYYTAPGAIVDFFKGDDEDTMDRLRTQWKRPEKKKYTYEQLKEILGEEFEIVKEI